MKLPQLSRKQMILAVVAVALLVALVVYLTMQEGFGIDKSGEYAVGTYPADANFSDLPARAPEYQVRGRTSEMPVSEMAAAGPDRAAGYGTSYHIVGEQVYPCNNDPNNLGSYPCGVDDYSIWQDGTKKDFEVNPVYGEGQAGGGRLRYFPASQNPYNYNSSGDCRCSANQNPRQTFDVNDNFIHVGRRWTGSNRWAKVGDQLPPAQPVQAPQQSA